MAVSPLGSGAADAPLPPAATLTPLLSREVVGVPGKEIIMATVEYVAGGASLPHRHNAQVFVYVLHGHLTMQVAGQPPVTLHEGQTFYEDPADIHTVSANASKTERATILVFMLKDTGAPATVPVAGP